MNRKLLTVIVALVVTAAVVAGGFAVTKAIRDRNSGTDPNAVTDPVNTGSAIDPNSGTNPNTGSDPNGSGQTGNSGSSGTGSNTNPNSGTGTGDNSGIPGGSGTDGNGGTANGNGDASGDSNGTSGNGGSSAGAKPTDSIAAYLIMGIDRHGEAGDVNNYHNGGQSDAMELLVVNDTRKTWAVIQIDRNTYVEMDRLDIFGTPYTTTEAPICLAYAQGSGTEKSAENAVRAVKRLFGDIPIEGYAAMTFEGLPALNDTLGGIIVRIEDDFSDTDPTLVQGETVELVGQHALNFVRGRMSVGDGSNVSRMRRQRAYLAAFRARLFEEMKVRSAIVNDLYNAAKPYMITDMSASLISRLAIKAAQYTDLGIFIPAGENGVTTGANGVSYTTFFADEDSLRSIVTELFGEATF